MTPDHKWILVLHVNECKGEAVCLRTYATMREMAAAVGVSPATLSNTWHGLIRARGPCAFVSMHKVSRLSEGHLGGLRNQQTGHGAAGQRLQRAGRTHRLRGRRSHSCRRSHTYVHACGPQ